MLIKLGDQKGRRHCLSDLCFLVITVVRDDLAAMAPIGDRRPWPCAEADANLGGSPHTKHLLCCEGSSLVLAGDLVFLHAGLQGRPLQAEPVFFPRLELLLTSHPAAAPACRTRSPLAPSG